ncbi:3'-5' RNA exonuclease complex component [Microbotryomycetes sp. JL201]|nr:3'-5' RNA exonuclease complex component [Microbotryomycetes sp. JL201]
MVKPLAQVAHLACTCRPTAGTFNLSRSLTTATSVLQRQPGSKTRTIHERVSNRVTRLAAIGARLEHLSQRSPSSEQASFATEDDVEARQLRQHRRFKLIPRRDQSNKVRLRSAVGKRAGLVRHLHLVSPIDSPLHARKLHTSTIEEISSAADRIQAEVEEDVAEPRRVHNPRARYPRDEEPVPFGSLVPGCFVESRSPERPRNMLLLSPNAEGETAFVEIAADDITFVLSKFITQAQARDSIGLPPDHPMIMNLLTKIRLLTIQIERDVRTLVSMGFAELTRSRRGHDDDESWSTRNATGRNTFTTIRILKELKIPTPAHPSLHLAAHRLMFEDSLHFVADPDSVRTTGVFTLRNPKEVYNYETVREWTRNRTKEFVDFVEKACRVRQAIRDRAPKVAAGDNASMLGIDVFHDQSLTWSGNDRTILRFLKRSLENERAFQTHPYVAIVPSILKAVEAHSGGREASLSEEDQILTFDRQRTREFLTEIGVVAPWENWVAHELPYEMRAETPEPSLAALTRPAAHQRVQDELENVRADFGTQNVYVIDDIGAKELDDGISIESTAQTLDGRPSWWVHAHVADPTGVLLTPGSRDATPGSKLSERLVSIASRRDHTVYFPEQTFPMLPEQFVEDARLSLGSAEGAQTTLVFSTRLTEDGDIIDTKVSAGSAKRFKRLTYAAVDEFLGHAPPPPPKRLSLWPASQRGPEQEANKSVRQLENDALSSDVQVQNDIKLLHKLSSALMRRRAQTSALFWTFPSFGISISPQLKGHFSVDPRPVFYKNLPSITMTLPTRDLACTDSTFTPSQVLVSEMMVLANRTAARFGVEKGVHLAYRSQSAPAISQATLDQVLAARNPLTGEASALQVLRAGVDFLPAMTSIKPGHHWPMGIQDEYGYTRATSPLRRYADLFTHWQIKSMLKPGATKPVFEQRMVEREIERSELINKARGRLSKHAEMSWAAYVLKLKLDKVRHPDRQPNLPEDEFAEHLTMAGLTGVAMRDPAFSTIDTMWTQAVWVQELGLRATLTGDRRVDMPEKGDIVNVKVEDVVVGARSRVLVSKRI